MLSFLEYLTQKERERIAGHNKNLRLNFGNDSGITYCDIGHGRKYKGGYSYTRREIVYLYYYDPQEDHLEVRGPFKATASSCHSDVFPNEAHKFNRCFQGRIVPLEGRASIIAGWDIHKNSESYKFLVHSDVIPRLKRWAANKKIIIRDFEVF